MKFIDLIQGSDEWLAWRKGGVTATDAAVLVNQSPYKTEWRLWAEKTGYAVERDLSSNPFVRHGLDMEPAARAAAEIYFDDLLLPMCAQASHNPLLRASLDGLNKDEEPVEMKCPSEATWIEVTTLRQNSKAFKFYYPQVQHQILVTGAKRGWLVFYFDGQVEVFCIPRDQTLIAEIEGVAPIFWDKVVKKREPQKDPARDLYIPQGEEMASWLYQAEEFRLLQGQISELEERLEVMKERQSASRAAMQSMMGDYMHADYCGVMVTRYVQAGKIDYEKLLADKSAGVTQQVIDSYRRKSTERCRVTLTNDMAPRLIVDKGVTDPVKDLSLDVDSFYI
ncbi:endonuclease [Comamonas thiooxydans]|uniref:Endonuclease n=2 Tax=Comamonas thiooxydans TaxID=363952 RepID=A0A0E3CGS7_9BURK|nr:YqaJ viral recombinase family protein [Comamonas thiooxydans]KGH12706.1 endonuclease [Comamonas thiooxydans]